MVKVDKFTGRAIPSKKRAADSRPLDLSQLNLHPAEYNYQSGDEHQANHDDGYHATGT